MNRPGGWNERGLYQVLEKLNIHTDLGRKVVKKGKTRERPECVWEATVTCVVKEVGCRSVNYCAHWWKTVTICINGNALQQSSMCRWLVVIPNWNEYLSICYVSTSNKWAGIATRYGLDGPGIESQWGARFSSRPALRAPPSLLYKRYRVFSGGKAAEAWLWPPTSI